LIVDDPRHVDAARFGKRLEPCGDVDAVAKDIAALEDDIAEMRMAMRRSFGSIWFICKAASRNAAAQRPASTTLSNSISTNSPARLKMFPPNSGISGSMTSFRNEIAVPATVGSLTLPPCSRIDLFKEHVGLDLTKMYPVAAPPDTALADNWTWDFFLTAAEKCFKAGYPFGLALGQTGDSVNWVGAVFNAYGAVLVDQEGNITVKSDATRRVLEWFKKLVPVLPPDVFAWDDASNNKWLISGKGALIMNPPSA
jgi:hypothetical protein